MIERSSFWEKGSPKIRIAYIKLEFIEIKDPEIKESEQFPACVIVLKETYDAGDIQNLENDPSLAICVMEQGTQYDLKTLLIHKKMHQKIHSHAVEKILLKKSNERGTLISFDTVTIEEFDQEKHSHIIVKLLKRCSNQKQVTNSVPSLNYHVNASDLWLGAAKLGDLEILKRVAPMVDVELTDSNGYNALHLATQGRHSAVVQFLLSQGVNPNQHIKRKYGMFTALQIAVRDNYLGCAEILLSHKADINLKVGGLNRSSIHYAKTIEMIQLLERHGVELKARDSGDFTIFDLHFAQGNKTITSYLEGKGFSPSQNTMLCVAIYGKVEIFHQLLSQGYSKNITGKYNFTLLHRAASGLNLEMIQELLKQGLKVDARTSPSGGYAFTATPLHLAASAFTNTQTRLESDPYLQFSDPQEIIRLLLASGANYKLRMSKGGKTVAAVLGISGEEFEERYREAIEAGENYKDGKCLTM
jgi:ankyrin repeat protein